MHHTQLAPTHHCGTSPQSPGSGQPALRTHGHRVATHVAAGAFASSAYAPRWITRSSTPPCTTLTCTHGQRAATMLRTVSHSTCVHERRARACAMRTCLSSTSAPCRIKRHDPVLRMPAFTLTHGQRVVRKAPPRAAVPICVHGSAHTRSSIARHAASECVRSSHVAHMCRTNTCEARLTVLACTDAISHTSHLTHSPALATISHDRMHATHVASPLHTPCTAV